jgi:alanine racemase
MVPSPNRLRLSTAALQRNWRALDRMSGTAACGAAVKADGYGLGAIDVARRLAEAGCRDLFVATWNEALALAPLGLPVAVLHGVRDEDMPAALSGVARPVLNTLAQVARWRAAGGGVCDVMVDTGMNRLGLAADELGCTEGLAIDTLHSHLASADTDSPLNERQRARFEGLAGVTGARRMSLANSAGIALGYRYDLTRPGLALYGGVPHPALPVVPVVSPEAQVVQRRLVRAGESVGYNETWRAERDTEVAILNIGYADGYLRAWSNLGTARAGGAVLPVIGRVSMDLVALDCSGADLGEGDWVALDYDLPAASAATGLSQYELLTGLGARFDRVWE